MWFHRAEKPARPAAATKNLRKGHRDTEGAEKFKFNSIRSNSNSVPSVSLCPLRDGSFCTRANPSELDSMISDFHPIDTMPDMENAVVVPVNVEGRKYDITIRRWLLG